MISTQEIILAEHEQVDSGLQEQAGQLLRKVSQDLAAKAVVPGSTYRLQFNEDFTFKQAAQIADYLAELGISHVYASPYLLARKGSTHGYDICDHNQISPVLGGEDGLREMAASFEQAGLGHIADFVPNHMGIGDSRNKWWNDVLENGPVAAHCGYFDIDWKPIKHELENKVLLPTLGDQYGKVLERGELQISFEPNQGAFYLNYYENRFPLDPKTYPVMLERHVGELERELGAEDSCLLEFKSIITHAHYLPSIQDKEADRREERHREKEMLKRRLATLYKSAPAIQRIIWQTLQELNGTPGDPASFDALDRLINQQAYRLAYWRVASEEINYRRFFDNNDLAAIRMENAQVFEESHRTIMGLLADGVIGGLRIDHADGLYDPAGYLWRVQKRYVIEHCRREWVAGLSERTQAEPNEAQWVALEGLLYAMLDEIRENTPEAPLVKPLYVVVEKILGRGESLPTDWMVAGTTGYEFTRVVNSLQVDTEQEKVFEDIYQTFKGGHVKYTDLVYDSKRQIMHIAMTSELNMLAHLLNRISERTRTTRDFTLYSLRTALREVIAAFPVYRTYSVVAKGTVEGRDKAFIETAIARAKKRNPDTDPSVFDFIRDILYLNNFPPEDEAGWALQGEFVMKMQQLTGPMMAKGLEDTAFYIYNRLISLNEVGGEPEIFGTGPEVFHRENTERQRRWPNSMLTTSTHDTKRSEDVRARINVLSEMPDEWVEAAKRWLRLNNRRRPEVEGQTVPERNEEYMLYQSLVGVWPFETENLDDSEYETLIKRVQDYLVKSLREAKINTSWIVNNLAYEEAAKEFVQAILNRSGANPFLTDFSDFQKKVAAIGVFNSLSQTLFKLTSPGMPDIYQGNELWDFSLVDPDNRRPVDYALRRKLLKELPTQPEASFVRSLLENCADGRIKLWLTRQLLQFRQAHPNLFRFGSYHPIHAEGSQANHVCAFSRSYEQQKVISVGTRLLYKLSEQATRSPLGAEVWGDTWLPLVGIAPGTTLQNWLTDETLLVQEQAGQAGILVGQLFQSLPVAFLVQQ